MSFNYHIYTEHNSTQTPFKLTEVFTTPTGVIFNATLLQTEHGWFQRYNTYHLAANDKKFGQCQLAGWLMNQQIR
jgi:hypothetical protein